MPGKGLSLETCIVANVRAYFDAICNKGPIPFAHAGPVLAVTL